MFERSYGLMFLDECKVTRASATQLESVQNFFFYQMVASRGLF